MNSEPKNSGGCTARSSNFEMLRVLAMVFIIAHHIAIHGNWGNGGVYFPDSLTFNMFFLQSLLPLGKIGVDLFVLISGYFLIKTTKNVWSKALSLWVPMLFYSLVITIAFVLFKDVDLSSRQWFSVFTPVLSFTWWFATTYLILLLLSPFINKCINSVDQLTHLRLIIGLLVLWCVIPTFFNIRVEYNELLWFIILYIIAAYVRNYHNGTTNKANMKRYAAYATSLFLILLFIVYLWDVTNIDLTFWDITNLISHNNEMNGLLTLLISLFIFLIFKNIEIPYSRIINAIAGTTFGIYLIHDHPLVRSYIYSQFFDCYEYTDSSMLIPYVFMMVIIIFAVTSIEEFARKSVMGDMKTISERIISKMDIFINSHLNRYIKR